MHFILVSVRVIPNQEINSDRDGRVKEKIVRAVIKQKK